MCVKILNPKTSARFCVSLPNIVGTSFENNLSALNENLLLRFTDVRATCNLFNQDIKVNEIVSVKYFKLYSWNKTK